MGEFKENRNVNEPFSLALDGNNSFEWLTPEATTTGTYQIDDNTGMVKFTFAGGRNFTAKYTSDKKLSNVVYGGNYTWEIRGIAFNAAPEEPLSGTVWDGTILTNIPMKIRFLSTSELEVETSPPAVRSTYTRRNGFISFGTGNSKLYGTVNGKSMSGVNFLTIGAQTSYANWTVSRP